MTRFSSPNSANHIAVFATQALDNFFVSSEWVVQRVEMDLPDGEKERESKLVFG